MAAEKVATSIPIEEYDPEKHDFDEYFDLVENAVGLATNTKDDRRDELTVQWVPLKLNERTRKLWNSCKTKLWKDRRPEFKELLRDPQDAYRWRAGHVMIVWDGKESFNEYAARVKRTVDTYEDPAKETDYYHHFRKGLPKDFIKVIDLGRNAETLDEAKRVAIRYQTALENEKTDATDPAGAGAGAAGALAFTGASMQEDRLEAIEQGLARLSMKVDDMNKDMIRLFNRVDDLVDQLHRSRYDKGSRYAREREYEHEHRYREERPDSRDHDDRYNSRHHYRDEHFDNRDRRFDRDERERPHGRDDREDGRYD